MNDHNNEVAKEMRRNIISAIHIAYSQAKGDIAANGGMSAGEERLQEIVKCFTGYGFGDGYDIEEILNTGLNDIHRTENWTLHEEYSWLCHKGIVPKLKHGMVGHKSVG